MMKLKALISTVLVLALTLVMLGCEDTAYTEKEAYYAGEVIRIYDKETDSKLGKVWITDIKYLSDETFEGVTYEAVLLISYDYDVLDLANRVNENNFGVPDEEEAVILKEHEKVKEGSFVVGLPEKGEFSLHFFFHDYYSSVCDITFEYDSQTEKYILRKESVSGKATCSCGVEVDAYDNYCWNCGEKID